MELYRQTARELLAEYRSGGVDPIDVVESVFGQIKKHDGKLKAYVRLTEERAIERARELKEEDRDLPLYGIPIAIKDNTCTRGVQTTCASKIMIPFKPPYDATVVSKLKAAGAIMMGKTNMDEFAMGSSCEHSCYFPTLNPWGENRVPGGSSGGSAAAVAADECTMAIGSDTGGSIRQPASFCGIVGMKPTYGAVSRYGLIAFASSLDQIGPMTKDTGDAALLLNVISGHDPMDSTSVAREYPDYVKSTREDVKGLKIGVISELLDGDISEGVHEKVTAAIARLEELGARTERVSMPNLKYALTAYYLIAPAEASSNLARFDGVQYGLRAGGDEDYVTMFCRTRSEGFGDEVKRRVMLGTYALSAGYYDAFYLKALKVRTLILREFEKAFEKYDALISPTTPTTSFKLGEQLDDPLKMYANDICTIPVNLAGIPAISIPCGLSDGLPVGLHVMGPAFGEEKVLQVASAYEKSAGRTARNL